MLLFFPVSTCSGESEFSEPKLKLELSEQILFLACFDLWTRIVLNRSFSLHKQTLETSTLKLGGMFAFSPSLSAVLQIACSSCGATVQHRGYFRKQMILLLLTALPCCFKKHPPFLGNVSVKTEAALTAASSLTLWVQEPGFVEGALADDCSAGGKVGMQSGKNLKSLLLSGGNGITQTVSSKRYSESISLVLKNCKFKAYCSARAVWSWYLGSHTPKNNSGFARTSPCSQRRRHILRHLNGISLGLGFFFFSGWLVFLFWKLPPRIKLSLYHFSGSYAWSHPSQLVCKRAEKPNLLKSGWGMIC